MAVTVRDVVLEVLRQTGMTRIFANPGSTEVAFLTDLPGDLEFVLALHEGSVAVLDEVMPQLGTRTEPLLLDVAVAAETTSAAPV